ncbi:MAG TPA: hypothetical protein VFT59_00110 [Candidatus Saccharimonadales bacterium]|nr:hypothetical protein [Candidatus Saccharimonadales bacterium]
MEIIERYIHAVTRHLPKNQRDEVRKELQATIEDMIADKMKDANDKSAAIEASLKELGHPDILAVQYSTSKQYLIGPKWYIAYVTTLKKLLYIVPGIIIGIQFFVGLFQNVPLGETIIQSIGSGLTVGVHIAFWVTLGFFIAERTNASFEFVNKTSEWKLEDLPELPKKRHLSLSDSIASMVLSALFAGMVIFATVSYLPWSSISVPFLNSALWHFWIPTFLVLSALTIVLELYKLQKGVWTKGLIVATLLLNSASVLFFILLFTTADIVNPAFIQAFEGLNSSFNWTESAVWVGGIALSGIVLTYINKIVKLIRQARQL